MDLSADKWRTQYILSKHLLILQLAFTKGPVREVRTETRWWLKFKKAGLLKRRFVCRTKYITTTVSWSKIQQINVTEISRSCLAER